MANIMLPKKLGPNHFSKENEFTEQLKKRDALIHQGKIIFNWINGVKNVPNMILEENEMTPSVAHYLPMKEFVSQSVSPKEIGTSKRRSISTGGNFESSTLRL